MIKSLVKYVLISHLLVGLSLLSIAQGGTLTLPQTSPLVFHKVVVEGAQYVALVNKSEKQIYLDGYSLLGDIQFDFSQAKKKELDAGKCIYIVADTKKFKKLEGKKKEIAGTFRGKLAEFGRIHLMKGDQLAMPLIYGQENRKASLDGDWLFADSAQAINQEWANLPVPASWNTFTEYADYIGDGWYQTQVALSSEWDDKRHYLRFDAVYDSADFLLGDTYLGQHIGGYTPIEFDVTDYTDTGQVITITVKTNNEHFVGAWFQWGGINRSVQMFAREDIRLIRQKIEPSVNLESGTSDVRLIVTVENKGDESCSVSIEGDVAELPGIEFNILEEIASGETKTFVSNIELSSEQTRLWHFDDPQLYNLETVLLKNKVGYDTLNDHFGIRQVDIKSDGLYLNGEKVRIMGYNRVHDHRAYGNTEPRHLVRSDIDLMKQSGGNFSRIMHAPCAPELLDYADKAGYLIWAEIPMWQLVYRVPMDSEEDAKNASNLYPGTALREMIRRDWNHPSIIGWSPGNELRKEASLYVKHMRPFVRDLDSTRLYANIHDAGFKKSENGGYKDLNSENVDILFANKYSSDFVKIKNVKTIHEEVPDKPIFYSEFGAGRDESLNHMVDFEALWDTLGMKPYMIGGAHWTFNDYRSYFKKTPFSQNRDWGIVDIWRNPKKFYSHMREVQQPIHALLADVDANNATVTIAPRKSNEIPSFTLRGYSWVYELIDENDATIEGGIEKLPEINPDDPNLVKAISWETEKTRYLVLSLISSTGYTVAETRYDLQTGEKLGLPTFPESANPEVRKVLPLDRGFMIGVTSLEGDTGLEVEYGLVSGNYSENLEAPVFGAIRVHGLMNGKQYFGRVRRVMAEGAGSWSPEFQVMPDGGLKPSKPIVKGIVEGEDQVALRLEPQDKVEGYLVTLDSGEAVTIERSLPGLLIIPQNASKLATIGIYGVSDSVNLKQ
ncbi:MAG: hypothetical protein JXR03_16390 [Cyclobacteriaceae bacterium]